MRYQDYIFVWLNFDEKDSIGNYVQANDPHVDDDLSIPELDVAGVEPTPRLVDILNLYDRALMVKSCIGDFLTYDFPYYSTRFSDRTLQYRDIRSIARFARTFAHPYGTTFSTAYFSFAVNNDDEIEDPVATSTVSMAAIFQEQFGPTLVRRLSNESTVSQSTDICDDFRKAYRDLDNLKRFIIFIGESGTTRSFIQSNSGKLNVPGVTFGMPFFPLCCATTTTTIYSEDASGNVTQRASTENGAKFDSVYSETYNSVGRKTAWFSVEFSEMPWAFRNQDESFPGYHGQSGIPSIYGSSDFGGFVGYRISCDYRQGGSLLSTEFVWGILPIECSASRNSNNINFNFNVNSCFEFARERFNRSHSEIFGKERTYEFIITGIWLDTGHWPGSVSDVPSDWNFGLENNLS